MAMAAAALTSFGTHSGAGVPFGGLKTTIGPRNNGTSWCRWSYRRQRTLLSRKWWCPTTALARLTRQKSMEQHLG